MKNAILLVAVMFSAYMYAQDTEPVFKQEGEKVKATYFHENGEVAQKGYFLDGKLHGEWTMFDETGNKIAMGKYKEGKRSGKWLFWEGKMLKEVNFTDNRITSVVQLKDAEGVAIIE